jgi:hypothetical protein
MMPEVERFCTPALNGAAPRARAVDATVPA